jgi:hypothetical protein
MRALSGHQVNIPTIHATLLGLFNISAFQVVRFTRHGEDPPKIVFHSMSVNAVHQLRICNY